MKEARGMAKFGLDPSLAMMLGVLLVLASVSYARGGSELLGAGMSSGARLLLRYTLIIVVSFLVAGLAEQMIPRESVERYLGDDSGLRGVVLAALAGALTPSGPFVSMPIAATMLRAGAGTGAVVAFVSAWSLLALHRLVAWEIPILGLRFALMRYGVCITLPVLAGWITRALVRS